MCMVILCLHKANAQNALTPQYVTKADLSALKVQNPSCGEYMRVQILPAVFFVKDPEMVPKPIVVTPAEIATDGNLIMWFIRKVPELAQDPEAYTLLEFAKLFDSKGIVCGGVIAYTALTNLESPHVLKNPGSQVHKPGEPPMVDL